MNEPIMGASPRRIDGRLKVTGQALYAADQHPDGVGHASLETQQCKTGSRRT
mgnify:CR=1 FL=1